MKHTSRTGIILIFLCTIAACGAKKQQSVWELYDVSHPLPTASGVAPAQGNPKKIILYQDNDQLYTPPKLNSNICGADAFGTFGCEQQGGY